MRKRDYKDDIIYAMRFEPFLLLQLLLGYTLASVCFVLGISLHAWQFWVTVAAVVSAAFIYSRNIGFLVLGLNVLAFVLTLYTFTYVHIDASICHLPVTHFLEDGWNPVRESSIEAVRSCFADRGLAETGLFSIMHIIASPKFSHILAAQMQSATGLFTALGYPLWIMCITLGAVAFRFASCVWRSSRLTAAAFAVLVASNYIIAGNSFFGLVDYVTYASIVISALSLGMWFNSKNPIDLMMFFGGAVIALSSKFNSLVCVAFLLLTAAGLGWKERRMRVALAVFFISLAVFCIVPYWTSAWCHGSPFYPAHSFRSDVPLMDLTEDFIGNEDACRMGYVARMVYAWISRRLAEWGCMMWYSLDAFAPSWRYDFLSTGENPFFCLLLWGGAALSLFFNRNRVTLLGWVLMAAFLALPVKYIGYSRYVSYVFFITVLFWFNVFAAASGRIGNCVRLLTTAFAVCAGGCFVVMFFSQVRAEGIRQVNIKRIAEKGTYGFSDSSSCWLYVLNHRLAAGGAVLNRRNAHELEIGWPFELAGHGLHQCDDSVCWSVSDGFPSPVWATRNKKDGGCE